MSALGNLISQSQDKTKAPAGGSALSKLIASPLGPKEATVSENKSPFSLPKDFTIGGFLKDTFAAAGGNRFEFQKQDAIGGNAAEGFAQGGGGGTVADFHVVTPKFVVKETPALGNFMPSVSNTSQAVKKTFNVVSQVAEGTANSMLDLADFGGTFIPKVASGKATKEDLVQGGAKVLRFGANVAGIAFSAISSELTAAEAIGIPGVSQVAALTNRLFEKLGAGGSYLAGKAVDVLPVSQATKDILRGPTQELGAMALPLLFAKVVGPATKKISSIKGIKTVNIPGAEGEPGMTALSSQPTTAARIAGAIDKVQNFSFAPLTNTAKLISEKISSGIDARIAAGENVNDPAVAKKIVNEVVKEVPADVPGEMKITKTDDQGNILPQEPIRVYTNQKLVLQNFIKGQEDITYKTVPSIGKDTNGNPITARFEWDYKNQRATMYVTKSSTAEDLAHELGHYYDKTLSAKVDASMSQILADYQGNKDAVRETLAAYAINRLQGDATPTQINGKVDALMVNLGPQIDVLSKGETRGANDKFAEAVKSVITDPAKARKVASDFADFVQFSLKDTGIIGREVKAAGGIKTKAEIKGMGTGKKGTFVEDAAKPTGPDIYLKGKNTDPIDVIKKLGFNEKEYVGAFGNTEEARSMAEMFWSRGGKEDVFYHIGPEKLKGGFAKEKARTYDPELRGGISMINGLYLGRDANALREFYGLGLKSDNLDRIVTKFNGKPDWLDLTDRAAADKFIEDVKQKSGIKNEKSAKFGDALEKEVIAQGYDGVRYFDPYATGEEFVLVNQDALQTGAKKSAAPAEKIQKGVPNSEPVDTGKPAAFDVVRFSHKDAITTNDVRGGTWYATEGSKTWDFTKVTGVGGETKTTGQVALKNPFVIKNANMENGSFAVINSGYEEFLPAKERALANQVAELLYGDKTPSEKKFLTEVKKILIENGNTQEQIDMVIRNKAYWDTAMDLVVSKGLKAEGYDGLVLENQYKGQVIDRHVFSFVEPTKTAAPKTTEAMITDQLFKKARKYPTAEEFVKAQQDVSAPVVKIKFGDRLKEGFAQMNSEEMYSDAAKMTYLEFVKKYEAYNLDGGGMSTGNKPAHAVIPKSNLFPSEYKTWDEFMKNESGITQKYSTDEGIKRALDYYNKSFAPPLVEKSGNEYVVTDGHHRVANLLAEGQDQIPVYFDKRILQKIWEDQSRKKVSAQEVKNTYDELFPKVKSKQELTKIWQKAAETTKSPAGAKKTAPLTDENGTPIVKTKDGQELADPADNGGVYYHGTTAENKASILKNGINTALNTKGRAEMPEAFYAGDKTEGGMYGSKNLVGIRVKAGETIKTLASNSQEWYDTAGKIKNSAELVAALSELKKRGYDAVNHGDEIEILNPAKFEVFDPNATKAAKAPAKAEKPAVGQEIAKKGASTTYYHGTNNAEVIKKEGFSTNAKAQEGSTFLGDNFAEGVHLSKTAAPYREGGQLSDVVDVLKVSIDAKNILKTDLKGIGKLYEKYGIAEGEKGYAQKLTDALKRDGYDGLSYSGETVVFDPNQVHVQPTETMQPVAKTTQKTEANPFKGKAITTPAFNEAKINAPEDAIKILKKVAEENKQFSKDRRSATLEEMRMFSYKFLGDENLYERLPSAIRSNIGMLKAAEQTVADLSSELANDFRNADLAKATPAERTALMDKQAKLEKVFRAFAGGRTEASHLLNSLRSEVVPGENNIMLAITNSGKKLKLEESQKIFAKLENVKKAAVGAGDFSDVLGKKKQLLDYFKARKDLEDYVDSMMPTHALKVATSLIGRGVMLASLKSPVTNIIGNTANGILQVAERRLSGGAFSGLNGEYAKDYMKFVNKVYAETGYDLTRMESFTTERKVLGETRVHAQGPGFTRKLGRLVEDWVFKKTQGAPDVAFSSFHFIDSVNLATTKIAVQEKLTGSAAKSRAFEIMKDAMSPSPKTEDGALVRKQAVADAMYATYQNDSHASKISLGIRRLFNIASGDLRLGDLNIPFAKTPANVVGSGIESSGGGIITGLFGMRDAIAKGKLGDEIGKRQATQKAVRGFVRAGIGISVGILISSLLTKDDFIGTYPVDAKERNIMQQLGGTENMIRIGNKWVSLEYFGPIGPVIAGFMYAKKYGTNWPDKFYRYLQGVGTQILRLPGINEIRKSADYIQQSVSINKSTADVLLDVENSLLDFFRARTVPGIVSDLSKMTNEAERETGLSPFGKLAANIPFVSNGMNERVDVLGDVQKTEAGAAGVLGGGSQLLFGSRVKSVKEDPVRLFLFQNDLSVSVPSKSTEITVGRDKRQMTPEEYYDYVKKSGPKIKAEIARRQSTIMRGKTADDRQSALNKIVQDIRARVKSDIERSARK